MEPRDLRTIGSRVGSVGYVAIAAMALMLLLAGLLTGCGSSNSSNTSSGKSDTDTSIQSKSDDEKSSADAKTSATKTNDSESKSNQQKSSAQSSGANATKKSDVNPNLTWSTISSEVTDSNGYTLKYTIKLSPWILFADANADTLDAAWKQLGQNGTFPLSDEDWEKEVSKSGGHYSNLYHCLGTIQIENVTDGWDATSANPITTHVGLEWGGDAVGYGYYKPGSTMIYSDGMKIVDNGHTLTDWHTLTSNKRGPIPFVLSFPENITPNYPEGEFLPDLLDGELAVCRTWGTKELTGTTSARIGVIGKDGKYYAPTGD